MRYLVALLLFSGCGRFTTPPDPECGFMRYDDRNIVWHSFPIQVHIDSQVPQEYIPGIEHAISIWNKATKKGLFQVVSSPSEVEIIVSPNFQGLKNQEAVTHGNYNYYGMDRSQIEIDTRWFWFQSGLPTVVNNVNMDSLMVHELGHVLGLVHFDGSVMNPSLPEGFYRVDLSDHEINALKCGYSDRGF